MKPNDPPRQDPTSGPANSEGVKASSPTFEIVRLIGHGAYGEVYLARDANGAFRAVKVIFRESFDHERPYEREYEGIRKFERVARSYDNQVQIFHVGRRENPQQFYYIMELADDQQTGQDIHPQAYAPKTLRSELKARGRLPVKECLRIGAALARALENLHAGGLVHRDIKPANIIYVKGRPKLADIGLVTDRDVTVSFVGTEGYIPPEGPGSAPADIYSLGKVLYEMVTGRNRLDYPELPTDLAELPDRELFLELNEVIRQACENDPAKRYRSTAQMLADLNCLLQGHSLRQRRRWKRRLILSGVAAGALLLLAAGTAGLWREGLPNWFKYSDSKPRVENPVWIAAGTPEQVLESQVDTPPTSPLPEGFLSLFNGADLAGWNGDPRFWAVKWHAIVGQTTAGNLSRANTFLIWTNGVFDDFELRVEYKIPRGNSGVQYRSRVVDSNAWVMAGYQADIDANNGDYFSGTLFDEGGPRGYLARLTEQVVWGGDGQKRVVGNTGSTAQELRAIIKPGDWNQLLIRAQGDHLVHTLNGRVVVDVTDKNARLKATSGLVALQMYSLSPGEVHFRNIGLKPLTGNGTDAVQSLPVAPSRSSPKKLLWVTVTKGFRHDVIPRSEEIMESLAQADGDFTLINVHNDHDMAAMMAPAALRLYDGAIFANTTGDLPLPDKPAFLRWIASGKAFIGVHAAIDTFRGKRPLDPFIQMIGAEFKSHGDEAQVDCLNQDPSHPACAHLPAMWTVKDEIYLLNGFDRRAVHGLLTLNREPNRKTPGDYPIAWCKPYGRGRVFFTSLGHREDVWTNPDFQQHLLGGIRWALNLTVAEKK